MPRDSGAYQEVHILIILIFVCCSCSDMASWSPASDTSEPTASASRVLITGVYHHAQCHVGLGITSRALYTLGKHSTG